jgi:hypothetical protein
MNPIPHTPITLYDSPQIDTPARRGDFLREKSQKNIASGTLKLRKSLKSLKAAGDHPHILVATLGLLLLLSLL